MQPVFSVLSATPVAVARYRAPSIAKPPAPPTP
jgi:hypothetical protein